MARGISVSPGMIIVDGYVLESPNLKYRGDMTIATSLVKSAWKMGPVRRPDGSKKNPKLREGRKLGQWAYWVILRNGIVGPT